jgi:DNA-binding NtrC family response regulator
MIYDAGSRHKSGLLSLESFRAKIAPAQKDGQGMLPSAPEPLHPGDEVVFPERLPILRKIEPLRIAETLKRSGGNQTIAAQILGFTRKALNNRLQRSHG